MPELPEVETIRRQLASKVKGKKLWGKKIVAVRRRAKMLFFDFNDGSSLVFHLKLTGQLLFDAAPSRFTREVFTFDDGAKLVFNDARNFGWWKVLKNTKALEQSLGPEPLDLTEEEFKTMLSKRRNAKIKPLLMDQKFLSGIGNIYTDEILFASSVLPTRLVKTLQLEEIRKIFNNIKKILRKAIDKGGSSVEYYLDAFGNKGGYVPYHKVYQRTDKPCSKCGTLIKRIKFGSRSAHFCPKCQV